MIRCKIVRSGLAAVLLSFVSGIASAQSPQPTPTPTPPPAAPPKAKPNANNAEIEFWSAVKDTRNPEELKAYLSTYPNGAFAALARVRLKSLESGTAPPTAAAVPGATPPTTSSPAQPAMTVETAKELQVRLHALNYPITKFDGEVTVELIDSVRRWQTQNKFQPTGQLTGPELIVLRSQNPPKIWGAIAFTARETYIVANKPSRIEAETQVMGECNAKGGKDCKAFAAPLNQCIAAAGYREQVGQGRAAAGIAVSRGANLSIAQIQALAMCGRQPASQGRCEIVDKVCGDGSHINTTPTAPKSAPGKTGRDT